MMLILVLLISQIRTGKLSPMVRDWRQIYRFFI